MTGFRHRKDLVTNVSLIIVGVFITHGDIGIGTILGSAVFNVLFVIGLCGVGAGTVRVLERFPFSNQIRMERSKWYPLFGKARVSKDLGSGSV